MVFTMTVLCFRSTKIRVAFWATLYKWLDVDSLVTIAVCVCNCNMQILCNELMLLMLKYAKVIGKIKKQSCWICACAFSYRISWVSWDPCMHWFSSKRMLPSSDMDTYQRTMLMQWGKKWQSSAVNYVHMHLLWSIPLASPILFWAP